MLVAIIITVSLIVLYISFKLFKSAAGSLSLLKFNTITYVFYVQIVLLTYVGSVLVATGAVDFHWLVKPVSNETKIYAWVGVMYSVIAMPIAMIVLNNLFRIRVTKRFAEYIRRPVLFRHGSVLSFLVLLIFCGISLFVLLYTFQSVENVPLFTALKGEIAEAAKERVSVRRNFGGIVYITNLLGFLMMPVFAYYAAVYAFVKRRFVYWVFFILLFGMAALLLMYDTQKAPIVLFLIGFMALHTLIFGGLSRKKFLIFAAMAMVVIAIGYAVTTDKDAIGQLTDFRSALYSRIFITEYGGYLLSLELFPDKITESTSYIGLPSFILDFFELPNVESARLLMIYMNPHGVASGESNLISSYYLGEAWANYGMVGILVAPFIVGIVVQSLHLFLLKNQKEPLILAFYSYMTVRWLLNSGFVNFLYLKIVLFPLIMFFLFKIFINSLGNRRIYVSDDRKSSYL